MIHKTLPNGFNSAFDVSACCIEHDGHVLMLHRQDHKPQGNTWSLPAGKSDEGETPLATILREVHEETGIVLAAAPMHVHTRYVKYSEYDFVYHFFHTILSTHPKVRINPEEHKAYRWVAPMDILSLPLIIGGANALTELYNL